MTPIHQPFLKQYTSALCISEVFVEANTFKVNILVELTCMGEKTNVIHSLNVPTHGMPF